MTFDTPDDYSYICGASAIADELKLRVKQVYHLAELKRKGSSNFPVWSEPGLGLVTTRAALREYNNMKISSQISR